MEARDLWAGRIVKVIDYRRGGWNPDGLMDKWQKQVVTIKSVYENEIKLEDDSEEGPGCTGGWFWNPADFVFPTNEEISEYKRRKRSG